jgi:filamentous hemagglutinin family protein
MKSVTTLSLSMFFVFLTNVVANKGNAQVKPDQTLGNESSILQGSTIQGGARRGNNIFHSFKELSVGASQRIDFSPPGGITNIITRVTDTPTRIDGTLGVTGNANLFLINPNGISFGAGAILDMTGTFIGSTASDIKFADGSVYGVTSTATPLLTMSVPVGLQFGRNPGSISLKESGDLTNSYTASSLVLVGGNINVDRSTVFVPGGKIELVAIRDQGTANIDWQKISNPLEVSVTAGNNRADITIQNESILQTDSNTKLNGHISLQGRNIEISDPGNSNTLILARSGLNRGNEKGGSVFLNATNNLLITGNSGVSTRPRANSSINGGDIVINALNLAVLDGSFLVTGPNGSSTGNGGDIKIKVSDTVTIASPRNATAPGQFEDTQITTAPRGNAKGNGGNIIIETRRLVHRDGSQISTDNSETNNSNSSGKLGDIQIVASESAEVRAV